MSKSVADLIAAHEPKAFEPFPLLSEVQSLGHPRLTVVVSCMDPRCSIDKFIDLNVGGERPQMVMQYRNAGGNVRHAVRDLLLLDETFKLTELVIVHHTDCGSLQVTEEGLRDAVKGRVSHDLWQQVESIEWGANTDMAESVRGDLKWLEANPLIREELKKTARGFLFDIKTGKAEEITLA